MSGEFSSLLDAAQRESYDRERDAAEIAKLIGEPANDPARALRLVDLNAPAFAPEFIIDGLVPDKLVTLLSAHGGAGKSILSLGLAALVATGKPFGEHACKQRRVLYLSLEDSADVVRYRLRNVAHELCLDWQTIEQNLVVYEGDAPLATELSDQRGQRLIPQGPFAELQEIARGFGLVIIDNASDAFDANENSRRIVRGFVRGMLQKQLADDGCAVLLIAHVPKAKPGFKVESYSGSTAWHNSARARLAIASGDTGPELVQEKSNHGAPCEPVKLVWSGAVLRAMTADELLDGPAADLSAVLEAFGRVDEDMRVSVAPQGTRAAWPMLKTFLPKDWTSKRLAQTLEDLERAGKLRKVKYVDEHRNSRLVWEVV